MCHANPTCFSQLCTILPITLRQRLWFKKLIITHCFSSLCPSWYQIILVAFHSHTTSSLFSSSCQMKISFLLFLLDPNFIKQTNSKDMSPFHKLVIAQITKIFPNISRNQKPIVGFTEACSLCLFWVKSIKSTTSHSSFNPLKTNRFI